MLLSIPPRSDFNRPRTGEMPALLELSIPPRSDFNSHFVITVRIKNVLSIPPRSDFNKDIIRNGMSGFKSFNPSKV